MKKFYEKFCRFEEQLALVLLAGLTLLVFVSALMRTIKHPLNWAQDVALVAFAWLIFIGGDIAVRGSGLIGVDLLVSKFPKPVQKWLDVFYKILIIGKPAAEVALRWNILSTGINAVTSTILSVVVYMALYPALRKQGLLPAVEGGQEEPALKTAK
jgi:TRAP-type C4-dicarboxylate transport system permease small subunit